MNLSPFANSSSLLEQPAALREKMAQDGLLFMPGLLPAEVIDAVGQAIMAICRDCNWTDETGRPQGGPRLEGRAEFWAVYDQVQQLQLFHALAHRSEIMKIIATLVGETPFAHPRNIARITFPQAEFFATPPHQDFVLIQGTPETYTVWMPLSDCPQALGGLAALAGSHRQGLLTVHQADGPGGLGVETDDLGLPWQSIDYQAGDVLILHSHTVHKALPHRTPDRLRLSVDYRYQGLSQPIVANSLEPHYGRLTWAEIYQGWTRPDLQYYWRELALNTVARDPSYYEHVR